ncbi:ETX/MTX2 family pore-forming toxin [Aquimarina algiphila]|uniref:Uncharacterized protein n=1 Tax=Aquimarina algiphila TaxID=2047982 RepID=A0A554VQQ5_9FLAO|nr:ETX/MTX2 family pore-forming toxin [Aquimarina algiphila]TSE10818.1 hypothetical protein FOF46_02965 [Aquimarina algiphila]
MSITIKNKTEEKEIGNVSKREDYKPKSAIEALAVRIGKASAAIKGNHSYDTSLINVPYKNEKGKEGKTWETIVFEKLVAWISKNVEFRGTLSLVTKGKPEPDGEAIESTMQYISGVIGTAKPSATYTVEESTSLRVTSGEEFGVTANVSIEIPFGVSAGIETSASMSLEESQTTTSTHSAVVSFPFDFKVIPGEKVNYLYTYKLQLIPMQIKSDFSIEVEAILNKEVDPIIFTDFFQNKPSEFNWDNLNEDQKVFNYKGTAKSKAYKGKTYILKTS